MKNLIACTAALVAASPAFAEVEASIDLRLVDVNATQSFLDGGQGKLRFGAGDDGLQLGRARLAARTGIGGDWHANIDLSAWNLHDRNVVDVTEAWLEWRPVPQSAWRSNVKVGAFYPDLSLEHRAPGWTNPYTLSSSALNTWVGEELRTIGVQYGIEHLGIAAGGRFDYGVNAAVFGFNDPAGVVLGFRGFALHDRQTPVFGRLRTYAYGNREKRVLFSEIDNRPGYHVGTWLKHDSGLELRAMHYDNRGRREEYKASISDWAWHTKFDSLGARYDGPAGLTLIAQWLDGTTVASPDLANSWGYRAAFGLVAQQFGKHRFAVRYDDFRVTPVDWPGTFWEPEKGHAFTAGWTWTINPHVEVAGEWMKVTSRTGNRALRGDDPYAAERSAQLSLKLSL